MRLENDGLLLIHVPASGKSWRIYFGLKYLEDKCRFWRTCHDVQMFCFGKQKNGKNVKKISDEDAIMCDVKHLWVVVCDNKQRG